MNRAFVGDYVDHVVELGGTELCVRSNPSVSFAPDEEVTLTVDPANVTIVPVK